MCIFQFVKYLTNLFYKSFYPNSISKNFRGINIPFLKYLDYKLSKV